jgi:predicted membrane channel-forming protein YqfA (hemolysin III family)
MSPIIGLIVILIVVGVLIWAAQRILAVLPVAEPFKTVIYVLIVLLAVFFLLDALGLLPSGFGNLGLHSRC